MQHNSNRSKLTALITAAVLSSASGQLWAQGDLQQRLQLLEKQLADLKSQIEQEKTVQAKKGVITKKGTRFQYGGYVKLDSSWSQYSDQQRANNVGDDFLVPSTIAVGDDVNEGDTVYDSNAKFSRLWFKTRTDTSAGAVTGYIEMDFNAGNDERLTNQSSNGLRHAFASWDYSDSGSLLMGQTWSTFFNVGALPEAIDFIGPTSGTLFVRQSQLRWTKKLDAGSSFMLAAENPSVGLYDAGGAFDGRDIDDSKFPDLVARYNGKAGNLSYSAAAVGRDITYDDGTDDDSEYGFGISLSGKYVLGNGDDLKFMVSHGNLGRYIALNAFRDGGVEADGSIETIDVTGGFVAYRHHWNDKLRSTFSYATATADNPSTLLSDVTETVSNYNINLLYSPTKALSFGAEWIHAERETESGADGELDRLQFMGKWAF